MANERPKGIQVTAERATSGLAMKSKLYSKLYHKLVFRKICRKIATMAGNDWSRPLQQRTRPPTRSRLNRTIGRHVTVQ